MSELVSFYWIHSGGIPRFIYKFEEDVSLAGDADSEITKDILLSGFLSAVMNFSDEVFKDEHLSQIELHNHKFYFARIPGEEFHVLCTKDGYDRKQAKKILENFQRAIDTKDIPVYSAGFEAAVLDKNIITELLQDAVTESLPRSLDEVVLPVIEENRQRFPCFKGYLVLDNDGKLLRKEIEPNTDFELSVFLESEFWEQLVLKTFDGINQAEQTFQVGTISRFLVFTLYGVFCIRHTPIGYLSIAFDTTAKQATLEDCNGRVLKELTKTM